MRLLQLWLRVLESGQSPEFSQVECEQLEDRLSALGVPLLSLSHGFADTVNDFECSPGDLFRIGRALCYDEGDPIIFGKEETRFHRQEVAKRAISFFQAQCHACRQAVDTWSLLAKRAGIVKDIRMLVGKLVWSDRESCLYKTLGYRGLFLGEQDPAEQEAFWKRLIEQNEAQRDERLLGQKLAEMELLDVKLVIDPIPSQEVESLPVAEPHSNFPDARSVWGGEGTAVWTQPDQPSHNAPWPTRFGDAVHAWNAVKRVDEGVSAAVSSGFSFDAPDLGSEFSTGFVGSAEPAAESIPQLSFLSAWDAGPLNDGNAHEGAVERAAPVVAAVGSARRRSKESRGQRTISVRGRADESAKGRKGQGISQVETKGGVFGEVEVGTAGFGEVAPSEEKPSMEAQNMNAGLWPASPERSAQAPDAFGTTDRAVPGVWPVPEGQFVQPPAEFGPQAGSGWNMEGFGRVQSSAWSTLPQEEASGVALVGWSFV